MSKAVKYHERTAVPTGGALTFLYIHDPKESASKVGIIAAALESGTQTGRVQFFYGEFGNDTQIHDDVFTADEPYTVMNPNFVIFPGQTIRIVFSGVTAGDIAEVHIGGH